MTTPESYVTIGLLIQPKDYLLNIAALNQATSDVGSLMAIIDPAFLGQFSNLASGVKAAFPQTANSYDVFGEGSAIIHHNQLWYRYLVPVAGRYRAFLITDIKQSRRNSPSAERYRDHARTTRTAIRHRSTTFRAAEMFYISMDT